MAKYKGRALKYGPSDDVKNKQLNLVLRAQEKLGYEDRFAAKWKDTEVVIPNDVSKAPEPQVNRGEMRSAPTTNPGRPRAHVIAYAPEANKLIVVFRDGTWWEYNNVPTNMWLGLKNSPSTGGYLRASGLDGWSDMGPANVADMPESLKEQISYTAQIASSIQNSPTFRNTNEGSNENTGTNLSRET